MGRKVEVSYNHSWGIYKQYSITILIFNRYKELYRENRWSRICSRYLQREHSKSVHSMCWGNRISFSYVYAWK